METTSLQKLWLKAGYELFALEGPEALKIEVLARLVNKNKSSFYHHFAELDIFINKLLNFHIEQVHEVVAAEKACNNIIPELVGVLVKYKIQVLFNRQLLLNNHLPIYQETFIKSSKLSEFAISEIWSNFLGLDSNSKLAQLVLKLSLDNFYLQISEKNLNESWLNKYLLHLKSMTFQASASG